MRHGPSPRLLTATRWRAWLGACLVTLVLGARAASAQAPGTAEELRVELARAATCYELVDYRCVIGALEGPIRVRSELPQGLSGQEVRQGHELLALGYLAVGLEDEAAQVFVRLLALQPDYRLSRPEVAPEHVALVARLAEQVRLERWGREVAQAVLERAQFLASIPDLRATASGVAARMAAVEQAAAVFDRARSAAPLLANPPLGAAAGPILALSFAWRPMFADDARAFDHGFGIDGRLGMTFAPLYLGVVVDWIRHATIVENPVITPPAPLDVVAFGVELGVRIDTEWVGGTVGLEAGGQYLHVSSALSAFAPYAAVAGEVRLTVGAGISARLGLTTGLVFGDIGPSDTIDASLDLRGQVGLSWSP